MWLPCWTWTSGKLRQEENRESVHHLRGSDMLIVQSVENDNQISVLIYAYRFRQVHYHYTPEDSDSEASLARQRRHQVIRLCGSLPRHCSEWKKQPSGTSSLVACRWLCTQGRQNWNARHRREVLCSFWYLLPHNQHQKDQSHAPVHPCESALKCLQA